MISYRNIPINIYLFFITDFRSPNFCIRPRLCFKAKGQALAHRMLYFITFEYYKF
jgi:hypothetical protein